MTFPAITICNLNKFRASGLKHLPDVLKVIKNHRQNKFVPRSKTKNDWNSLNERKRFFLQKMASRSGISPTSDMNYSETNAVSRKDILEAEMLAASARYSEKELKKAGHQFEDLVVGCRWMGIQCNSE